MHSRTALRVLLAGLCLAVVSGCANPFQQSYMPAPGATADVLASLTTPCQDPVVTRGPADAQTPARMYRRGFMLMGTSAYNAQGVSDKDLTEFARQLGACEVLLHLRPVRTEGYTYVESYNPGYMVYYGRGGYGWGGGFGVYTPGYYSGGYVPYVRDSFDVTATFWAKMREPMTLGIWADRIPDPVRKAHNLDRGAYVIAVRDNSPADQAGILAGDVILRIGDKAVDGEGAWNAAVSEYEGRPAVFTLVRDGKSLRKTVILGGARP
ncbi:hypothetical protein JCM15519_18990 [Fundidesulfovibrio butyratiphilus]